MKIGQLVKLYLPKIFKYCEEVDQGELNRLMSQGYSYKTFHLTAYPFCQKVSSIPTNKSRRYWQDEFKVQGETIRVCCEWFVNIHKDNFVHYLTTNGIVSIDELKENALSPSKYITKFKKQAAKGNSRYGNTAIGNAQNSVVRNILSNLGAETFSEKDWEQAKEYFSNCCAYCGSMGKLEMDHAIPINRQMMGEHRLGNLVPACNKCNRAKSSKDFREFLGDNEERIQKIESYMESNRYKPLDENEHVAELLEMAYRDVADVATRYITIINRVLE